MTPSKETAVRTVIGLLVNGEYDALATMTGHKRLTGGMLRTAIAEYGRTLVIPQNGIPPDIEEIPDVVNPDMTHVVMSLWTEEEGRSDLSLELTLITNRLGLTDIEIDNLHVLLYSAFEV